MIAIDTGMNVKRKDDKQLIDIYLNAKDYKPEYVKLVREELLIRKIPVDTLQLIINKKEETSDETLSKGIKGHELYIIICYVAAILGGLISIVAGYIYAYSKHKNSKGEEVFVYDEKTRSDGRLMMIIGSSVLVVILYFRLKF